MATSVSFAELLGRCKEEQKALPHLQSAHVLTDPLPAFAEPFDSLVNARTHPWIQNIQDMISIIWVYIIIDSWGLIPLLNLLLTPAMKRTRDDNQNFISKKIHRRIDHPDKDHRGDFLDPILKHDILLDNYATTNTAGKSLPQGMTVRELESNATDLVFAGSETTATLLSGIIYYLLHYSAYLQRATTEIRAAFPTAQAITLHNATAEKLPFTMAIISESLRIFPPAPNMLNRALPAGGGVIDGRWLPAGTRVGVSHYPAFRSDYNFHRAREFVPERWLDGSTKERDNGFVRDNKDNVFQPFSYGPRNCLGRELANAEVRLILARVLWRFDLARAEGREGLGGGHVEGVQDSGGEGWLEGRKVWLLWDKRPLWVDLRVRGDMKGR